MTTETNTFNIGSGKSFTYSATSVNNLQTEGVVLVTLLVDVSGSTQGFSDILDNTVGEVIKECSNHPLAEQIQVRVCTFNSSFHEYHGFKPLTACNASDYQGLCRPGGMTALYDALVNVVGSTVNYGSKICDLKDLDVNGIIIALTDGIDCDSSLSPKVVKSEVGKVITEEKMESLQTILVGVNAADCSTALMEVKRDCGFDQYAECGDVAGQFAKLANWISKSISMQSNLIGTGMKSQGLNF